MDLRYSEADEAFRKELGNWLDEEVPKHGTPPGEHDWDARREYDAGWQRKLYDAGYAGITWPKEYGGLELPATQQLAYFEEIARARAPYIGVNFVGILHGGPTVIAEGTPEQKARHIEPILKGEQVWCQGFSEPVAGSDLASLQTKAVRDGDHYVVNGHKIWTSFAQVSDYCELLVRTDFEVRKHAGISWLIMPMDLPGIDIRPLPTIIGSSEFSEVFLEDVRIPVDHLVGKENDGWRVTNVTLRFERGTAMASEMVLLQEKLRELIGLAKVTTSWEGTAWEDRGLRKEIGHLQAELDGLWAMVKLQVSEAEATGMPGLASSAVKLFFTDLNQRVMELGVRLLGRAGLTIEGQANDPSGTLTTRYLNSLSLTIAAGTSQIQRNIIGERILGQPKER